MTVERFRKVRRYRRPIGRRCVHCGRPATVTAERVRYGFILDVRYCDEHAALRIDGGGVTDE